MIHIRPESRTKGHGQKVTRTKGHQAVFISGQFALITLNLNHKWLVPQVGLMKSFPAEYKWVVKGSNNVGMLCTVRPKYKKSRAIAKMTAQCALYMIALKIFGSSWLRLWLNDLLFWSSRMCVQKLKFVVLPVPGIIWGIVKFWTVLDTPPHPFSWTWESTGQIWSP